MFGPSSGAKVARDVLSPGYVERRMVGSSRFAYVSGHVQIPTGQRLIGAISLQNNAAGSTWDVVSRRPFWSSFEDSKVPMCLVDTDRLVVASTEAAHELFGTSREEAIGTDAGRRILDEDPGLGDKLWQQLRSTNELYTETLVTHADGRALRVAYAGHGTTIDGRWHALMVVLSVRFEPDGEELISTDKGASSHDLESTLTPREREVIRLVAQGANSRQIAAELYLSPSTVRSHVRNAMVKTQAHTRAQLVAIVLGDGFID
ncbi:MAG TPA: LuxR C-terminal-related transcriptional regulator [Solirubrobacteraceae bacterium]|nr:LuxR C-terminal-related transcriptional regulator [Solirubrobacteraceae bacterium]